MDESRERIFTPGGLHREKQQDSPGWNYPPRYQRESNVEKSLRRIEARANPELVIAALEMIENAQTIPSKLREWTGSIHEQALLDLEQALGLERIQRTD